MLPEAFESNIYEENVEPSMHMLGQPDWMNCGRGFIFVLPYGRLIVQDGGMNYSDKNVKDFAYNAIKKVAPDPDNIVIAAWFLSHPNEDHQDAFIEFIDANHRDVKLESAVYSYAANETYYFTRGDGIKESGVPAEYLRECLEKVEKRGIRIIKAHTRQMFNYGNVQIEVIHTAEDCLPGQIDYGNSTSMVIRLYFEDRSILLLADTTHRMPLE